MKGNYIVVLFRRSTDGQHLCVPPHLLIAVDGKTWSISVSGQLPGEPLDKLFSFIHRKKVPTIFSTLNLPASITSDQFQHMLDEAVAQYPEVHANEVSCLHPIRDVAAAVFGDKAAATQFIFELIPAIQHAGGIGAHYGFYMDEYLDADKNLAMPLYTAEDVANATIEAARQYAESK